MIVFDWVGGVFGLCGEFIYSDVLVSGWPCLDPVFGRQEWQKHHHHGRGEGGGGVGFPSTE